ncbi:G-type lectin S-receptor-like serine/threonine-protein kinase B120 [Rosa sericea]
MEFVTGNNPGSVFQVLSIFLIVSCSLALFCSASSSITQSQTLKDGQTLISDNQTFELGFFSPVNSSSRYVGIWYYNLSNQTIVWVANREKPISDKAGVLTIGSDGNLVIRDGNSNEIWSSNVSSISNNTSAVLKDMGNLVLSTNETTMAYWDSFDFPTDTFLPGMRVKVNAKEGVNRAFRSWKSANDPAPGDYFSGVDPRAAPQLMIWNGSERRWRSGHWNKLIFIGLPDMPTRYSAGFSLTDRADQNGSNYLSYTPWNESDKLRFRIGWDGNEEQSIWVEDINKWVVLMSQPNMSTECELYNKCGNFGLCSASDASCDCMQGFERKNWGNWSDGCSRKTLLKCQRNSTTAEDGEDGFVAVKCTKVPDFADLVVVTGPQVSCEQSCLNNCSCTAYADVSGLGCMIWTTELVDVQQFSKGGNTLYIRVAHADLGGSKKLSTLVISLISAAGAIFVAIFIFLVWRFRAKLKVLPTTSISWLRISETPTHDAGKSKEFSTEMSGSVDPTVGGNQVNGPDDLPSFSFNSVAAATDHFSLVNKLGNGGFGTVYKGILPGLEEVAVKRLSQVSCQGLEEFKNEINLIAKLQHRNLVRLVGCCIEGEEKMLLYEYMPNKSLDFFLFDATKQAQLNWSKRFLIIEGIARGLLYLHRDSRLRIIHRDLKASNILLDEDMIPKISDFGMARIFGGNQNEINTMRVVGTYGYMSPEYAMEGLFSVKSDVYSFGVLLLEIVSGRRNTSLRTSEHLSLIGYAWNLWNANTPEDLIDPSIAETCNNRTELVRCIHVGLLCVQDSADSRPTMSSVVLMLESETANLPLPREPMFTSIKRYVDTTFSTEEEAPDVVSVNHVTVTMLDGR